MWGVGFIEQIAMVPNGNGFEVSKELRKCQGSSLVKCLFFFSEGIFFQCYI